MKKAPEAKYRQTTMKGRVKSLLLLFTFVISYIPKVFFGTQERMNLSILVERSTRLDFVAMYYCNSINFIILAYMVAFNSGIDKRVSNFILIVTLLDFIHLFLFAGQSFGGGKLGITAIIFLIINRKKLINATY